VSHYNLEYHRSRSRELLAEAQHERLLREARKARAPRRLGAYLASLLHKRASRSGAAVPAARSAQPAK
jgi:hypothetical protein